MNSMSTVKKRRRSTAIVKTPKGILVVASHSKVYLLPGGEANNGELRTDASVKELKEETGLIATKSSSFQTHRTYTQILFRWKY